MFIELVKGVSLLLALCFLHGVSVQVWRSRPRAGQWCSGLIFGSICVIGMLTPLTLEQGVIFDARSVVLSMAGLFGGPLVAGVAAAMAAMARLYLGGAGVLIGLLVILLCVGTGLAYRWLWMRGRLGVGPIALACFGLLVHVAVLTLFQFLPADVAQSFNERVALPFLLTFTVATVILGLLLRDVGNRLSIEHALADAMDRLRAISQAIPDVLLVFDDEGRYVQVLSQDDDLLPVPASELVGLNVHDVLTAETAGRFMTMIRDTLSLGGTQCIEYERQTRSGRHAWFEGRARALGTLVNGRAAVVFMARDVTQSRLAEKALWESEWRFRSVLFNIPAISVQGYREDGTTTYWNRASEHLYGYTAEEAMGRDWLDLIAPPALQEGLREDMRRMFETGIPIPAAELRLHRKDGSAVDVFASHAFIQVPGRPPEMFCIDIDITGRKAAEEEAHHLAFYDALTQLPNRRLLVDRLRRALAGGTHSGLGTAVFFLGLDHFKALNDTQGHEVGDLLLLQVGRRLRDSVRDQDTVARLGGDGFAVVAPGLSADAPTAAAQARALGELILARLREPCDLAGHEYHGTASIGVTLLDRASASADEALKQADMAMYRAKESGRDTISFFDSDMQRTVSRRATLEVELRNAVRQEQFLVLYQPQVDVAGRVTGAEALVRWQHPVHGMVPPSEFIPLAEETGLILPLGRWVMETVMRQQARWRHDPVFGRLDLAINVSPRQFRQEDFVAHVQALLHDTGADPARIKLELTESLLLHSVDRAIEIMRALRVQGLGFALDDFGTGYSSLNYLKRLPLSQIKIDQSFVRGVLRDPSDAAIARSIIALADSLGLGVIAEGVETEAHRRFLQDHGCPAFQGYLFGRPMALDALEQQVRAGLEAR
ncbi:EAL domain-containing protein [Castellaniella hirudinis]|uniref:EAL domain-containing protein n=1 Tax=Castellaniella hirudinis TaxID=1144617 RepID=A0ABV8RUB6_9BURK